MDNKKYPPVRMLLILQPGRETTMQFVVALAPLNATISYHLLSQIYELSDPSFHLGYNSPPHAHTIVISIGHMKLKANTQPIVYILSQMLIIFLPIHL